MEKINFWFANSLL